ncbi:sensor histidine kinase [Streptomyces zhihengii]|uniref:histidine kinase n=1 Tax=Streptomyces zhihengii TaxID=1818004 RepID=A0ABS2UYB7_9ACTN|nr:ATP-binding protein [Streptomyces zhihengii]MBM9622535.1 sensor histidine kinase [Streptomyces zhihengii]
MVRQGTSTGSPRPRSGLVWQLPVAATVAAAIVAVFLVSASARTPVVIVSAVTVVAVGLACAEVVRRGQVIAELRDRLAAQEAENARQSAETSRLAGELLPHVVGELRKGAFPEDVLASLDVSAEHRAVLRSVVDAVSAEEDLRGSAQRAFVNIARRVQAIVHQQAQELREMEDRHGRTPEVFGDLLRIDHGTALIGRLADSIAVLGGARPGRQWSKSVPLYSVMRGAMSRIIDYQRVELHTVSEVAVVGSAVEPLIHALSELLDNATRYSPPQTRVHLTAVDVQSGIAIEIEDGGVSMSEEARQRAERMLRQAQQGIDVNDLGETPRLGLAVVGRLAQAYGFQVSLRSSAYGGVRAVLVVPQDLITTSASATGLAHGIGTASGPRATGSAPAPAPLPPRAPAPARPQREATGPSQPLPRDEEALTVTERTAGGLPQRRRKSRVSAPAEAFAAHPTAPEPEPEAEPAVQPGMWLAAFQNGLSGDTSKTNNGNEQP